MRTIPPEATGRQLRAFLAHAAIRSRRIQWKIRPELAALARNKAVLGYLLEPGDWEGLAPPYRTYQARFAANQYHFAGDRIAMLALAHSTRARSARRFERMIATKLPETPLSGSGTETPVRGPLRLRTCRLPKPKSEWTCDLYALIAAYGTVRQRQDRESELAAAFARFEALPLPPTMAWPPRGPLDTANRAGPRPA